MNREWRPTGIPLVQEVPWGTHICHFFASKGDLTDAVVPFFRAGLLSNERCLWITSKPVPVDAAWRTLQAALPDLDRYRRKGQIEVCDFSDHYLRCGRVDGRSILQGFCEREKEALRQGFDGLRISGNTSWLEHADWQSFAEYETQVHKLFPQRRMIALCSYWLDRCGADEIVDVLRNHKFALLRRAGQWEAINNATSLLATMAAVPSTRTDAGRARQGAHDVQFYEAPEFLAERVAEFAIAGLTRKEAVLLISAAPNTEKILHALRKRGTEVDPNDQSGPIVMLNARELLAQVMPGGRPSKALFYEVVGALVDRMRPPAGRLRAYGEMVNLLMQEGKEESALEIEQWWNEFLDEKDLLLLCGYQLDTLSPGGTTGPFRLICGEHSGVSPAEGAESLFAGKDPERLLAELQHTAKVLAFEARTRLDAEEERARLTHHLTLLQKVTSSLSGALTSSDIARVVSTEMAAAVEADLSDLAVLSDSGAQLKRLAGAEQEPQSLGDVELPLAAAFQQEAVWLASRQEIETCFPSLADTTVEAIACLPLCSGGRRLGAIGFGYLSPQEFTPARRALLEDLTSQVGLALDRSLLYERVEKERQRAEEASRTKDAFLAMLGHELRNPLAPIMTALEVMRLRGPGASVERERDTIERQVRNLVRLVDDLLDVARVTRGKVTLKKQLLEASVIVNKAIEMAGPLLEERAHALTVNVPACGLVVDVDEARMAQVLGNLLINAAKYTEPRGHITVAASASAEQVVLEVGDTGCGIDAYLLPRLFDMFVQGHRTPDRAQGGLGIGLTVARTLVELHGGQISAASDGPGAGSRFTVRLPRPILSAPRPPSSGPIQLYHRVSPTDSRRILIVDDNRDAADGLAYLLRRIGHTTRVAYDGPQALAMAEEFCPDIALLDIGLPVMDGFELAEQLRRQARGSAIRFIAITGYGQDVDRAHSRTAGFHAHLVKPVDFAQLQAAVILP